MAAALDYLLSKDITTNEAYRRLCRLRREGLATTEGSDNA